MAPDPRADPSQSADNERFRGLVHWEQVVLRRRKDQPVPSERRPPGQLDQGQALFQTGDPDWLLRNMLVQLTEAVLLITGHC